VLPIPGFVPSLCAPFFFPPPSASWGLFFPTHRHFYFWIRRQDQGPGFLFAGILFVDAPCPLSSHRGPNLGWRWFLFFYPIQATLVAFSVKPTPLSKFVWIQYFTFFFWFATFFSSSFSPPPFPLCPPLLPCFNPQCSLSTLFGNHGPVSKSWLLFVPIFSSTIFPSDHRAC